MDEMVRGVSSLPRVESYWIDAPPTWQRHTYISPTGNLGGFLSDVWDFVSDPDTIRWIGETVGTIVVYTTIGPQAGFFTGAGILIAEVSSETQEMFESPDTSEYWQRSASQTLDQLLSIRNHWLREREQMWPQVFAMSYLLPRADANTPEQVAEKLKEQMRAVDPYDHPPPMPSTWNGEFIQAPPGPASEFPWFWLVLVAAVVGVTALVYVED